MRALARVLRSQVNFKSQFLQSVWVQGIKHRSEDFQDKLHYPLSHHAVPPNLNLQEKVSFSLLNKQLPFTSCKSFSYDLSK